MGLCPKTAPYSAICLQRYINYLRNKARIKFFLYFCTLKQN